MSSSYEFTDCYAQHYQRLVRSLELAGASHVVAEDVAQDAFAIALRNWRRIVKGSNPAGYVYRVAFRSLRRQPAREIADADPKTAANQPVDVALRLSLEEAIASLPARRRDVAVLALVLGFSTAEIAELFNIADATVRKHIEEARRDLQRWLMEADD